MYKIGLLLVWITSIRLQAQSPAYLHYDVDDGLPSNLVYCALEDSEGYMWFGTDNGLSRFDGERFSNYNTRDGLPNDEVLDIYEDSYQRLWLACFSKGLAYRKAGKIHSFKTDERLRRIQGTFEPFGFCEDLYSNLWLTAGAVFTLRDDSLRQQPIDNIRMQLMRSTKLGSKLIGFTASFISEITPGQRFLPRILLEFSPDTILHSFAISGDHILLSSNRGTFLYAYSAGTLRLIGSSSHNLQSLFTDRRGRFWGCSTTDGAICFDNTQADLSKPVSFLPKAKIAKVYQDKKGDMWFLSSGQGVYRLGENYALCWNESQGLQSAYISALSAREDQGLLVGDDLGHVYAIDSMDRLSRILSIPGKGNNFIRQIIYAGENDLYITADVGFYHAHFNGKKWMQQKLGGQVGGSSKYAIQKDSSFWVARSNGLIRYDIKQQAIHAYFEGRTLSLAQDAQGRIWQGNMHGIFSEEDSFRYNWGDRFPMLRDQVSRIKKSRGDQLLLATESHGLLRIRVSGGQVRSAEALNAQISRPIYHVRDFCEDAEGRIWLGTASGLYAIHPGGRVDQFDQSQGLQSQDIHSLCLQDPYLWIGSSKGISRLLLSSLNRQNLSSRTALVSFQYRLRDSLILEDHWPGGAATSIRVPAGASMLEAKFATLQPMEVGNIQYKHVIRKSLISFPWFTFSNLLGNFSTLLGLSSDGDSVLLDEAAYNLGISLPPGEYSFRTTALLHGGLLSGKPVDWQLSVVPHWYETIWVWLLLLVLLLIWLWRIYRLRVDYIGARASASQFQLQALRSQINPHFVGNSINAIQQFFYPPDPRRASEYIHVFTGLLRKTLYFSEKDFISFEEEIEFNKAYLDMIRLRYGDQFQYEIRGGEELPRDLAFPAMLLQPILENATIHGLAAQGISVLKLDFAIKDGQVICSILDNGIGMQESRARNRMKISTHRSKGGEIVENKIKTLNAVYQLNLKIDWEDIADPESQKISGTRVRISFTPINMKEFP